VTISQDARRARRTACGGEYLDFEDAVLEVVEVGGELIERDLFQWWFCGHGV